MSETGPILRQIVEFHWELCLFCGGSGCIPCNGSGRKRVFERIITNEVAYLRSQEQARSGEEEEGE